MLRICAVLLAVSLAGCGPSSERVAQFKASEMEMQRKAQSGQMSWAAYARESNRLAAEADPRTFARPDAQTALAYRVMIAAEVDAGRMTPEQYEYLWKRQVAAMSAKEDADAAAASAGMIQAGNALMQSSRPAATCTTVGLPGTLQTSCF